MAQICNAVYGSVVWVRNKGALMKWMPKSDIASPGSEQSFSASDCSACRAADCPCSQVREPSLPCAQSCNRRDVCPTFANSRASPFHIAQKECLQPQPFCCRALRPNPSAKAVSIICEGKFPNLAILVGLVGALYLQLVNTWMISANASLCVILLK